MAIYPLYLLWFHIFDSIFHHRFPETSIFPAEESWHCWPFILTASSHRSLGTQLNETLFKTTDILDTFLCHLFSRTCPPALSSQGTTQWHSLGDPPFTPSRHHTVLWPHIAPRKEHHGPYRPGVDPRRWKAAARYICLPFQQRALTAPHCPQPPAAWGSLPLQAGPSLRQPRPALFQVKQICLAK